ncbi:MAG: GntR family transcriptional regulator [Actinomycetota bacterium]
MDASVHLADVLRAQILDGCFTVGEPLPSEAELRITGRAGRNVVRAALDLLRRDGFITRRPGRGTIVCSQRVPLRLDRPTGISGSFDGKGHRVVTRFRSVDIVRPIDSVASRLRIEPDQSCLVVDYETVVDDRPYAVATSYLPIGRCGRRFDTDLAGHWLGDWFQVLETLGFELGGLELRMEAAVADETIADVLGVAVGSPIFRFERLLSDGDGRPLDYGFSRCLGTAVVIDMPVTAIGQRPDGPEAADPT